MDRMTKEIRISIIVKPFDVIHRFMLQPRKMNLGLTMQNPYQYILGVEIGGGNDKII